MPLFGLLIEFRRYTQRQRLKCLANIMNLTNIGLRFAAAKLLQTVFSYEWPTRNLSYLALTTSSSEFRVVYYNYPTQNAEGGIC